MASINITWQKFDSQHFFVASISLGYIIIITGRSFSKSLAVLNSPSRFFLNTISFPNRPTNRQCMPLNVHDLPLLVDSPWKPRILALAADVTKCDLQALPSGYRMRNRTPWSWSQLPEQDSQHQHTLRAEDLLQAPTPGGVLLRPRRISPFCLNACRAQWPRGYSLGQLKH